MTSWCLFHIYVKRNKNPDPRIPDPYESRLVEVRSSEIEGGNEGLFAKQFLEVTTFQNLKRNVLNCLLRWHISQVNTTISFYNGIRARPEDFNPDTWETNNYKVCVICMAGIRQGPQPTCSSTSK